MNPILESLLLSAASYPSVNKERREETFRHGQHPEVALLCCSDSRVIPEEIFNASIGDLFVIRTAGNTLGPNEEASFGYAYHHLHIKTFVVLGHTHCGAVSSALHQDKGALFETIRHHIGQEKDPIKAANRNALAVQEQLQRKFPHAEVFALSYDIETGIVSPLTF